MTNETKILLENTQFLYVENTDQGYTLETHEGVKINDPVVSIHLTTPLSSSQPRTICDYLLDETTTIAKIPVESSKLTPPANETTKLQIVVAIARLSIIAQFGGVQEVTVKEEEDITELKLSDAFLYSKRISCDCCKKEYLVLLKEAKSLTFSLLCKVCKKHVKKVNVFGLFEELERIVSLRQISQT